ncbi:unnamed protein product [Strongylus vulgaris]|uniref:Uncharacterized protein n=1 Tax=Strongylus vulgaris TaxID=40348 RepID=A0A3P7I2D3_STRVU|nr:unnamed protein product [Strongylus vulgaris]
MSKLELERSATHHQQKKVEPDNDWGESKKGGGKKKGGKSGSGKTNKSSVRDDSTLTVVGVPPQILEEWITATNMAPEEILEDIVERIGSQIDDKVRTRLAEIIAVQQNAAAQFQKKSLAQLQEKAQTLYSSISMFETASTSFPEMLVAAIACLSSFLGKGTELAQKLEMNAVERQTAV